MTTPLTPTMTSDPMHSPLDMLYHAFPSAAPELTQVLQAYSAAGSNSPHAATLLLKQASPYLAQSPLVLVSGPTGIGKSFLIHHGASHFDIQTTTLLPGLIDLHFPHLPERGIDYHFYAAKKRAVELGPGRFALILDNIDTLFTNAEMGFALVHNLRTLLADSTSSYLVIATTREPDRVPDTFRSFVTDTINVPLPTQHTRQPLLSLALHVLDPDLTTPVPSEHLALASHPSCSSFLFADYVSLAALLASTPTSPTPTSLTSLPSRIRASTLHTPTSTSSLITPTTTFSTLGGFHDVKSHLTRYLLWPQPANAYASAYARLHLAPTAGILLFGPPGTGKTLLASALAGECGLPFMSMSVAQLVRGYVGESEKQVAKVFAQARGVGGGCVVFVDEVDAVFSGAGGGAEGGSELASKMVAQLVMELDTCASAAASEGLSGRVVVVAATNHPWMLGEAVVRPGRLDAHVYVGLPDERDRGEILDKLVGGEGERAEAEWVAEVARCTEGYSGADLKAVVVRAQAILAAAAAADRDQGMREQRIEWAVKQALGKVKPSVKKEEVERVEKWMRRSKGAASQTRK